MAALHEEIADFRQLTARDALQIVALCLEMNAEPDTGEVQRSRYDGSLYDIDVRDAHELSHEECGSAHDRRHELAARRSSSLDSTREILMIAEFLHHRYGQRASTDDVSHRAARDGAHEARGQYRDLRRTAARPARDSVREIDEELAEAGRLQIGAEQDEQEYERRGNAQRYAEYALGREEEVADELLRRQAAVSQHARHIGSGVGIGDESQHDADHRDAHHAARGLDDEQYAQQADGKVGIRYLAGPQHELVILYDDVGRCRCTEYGQHEVERMQLVTRP